MLYNLIAPYFAKNHRFFFSPYTITKLFTTLELKSHKKKRKTYSKREEIKRSIE